MRGSRFQYQLCFQPVTFYGRSHCFPVASMRPPPETEVVL